jgi:hypothetical protein
MKRVVPLASTIEILRQVHFSVGESETRADASLRPDQIPSLDDDNRAAIERAMR